jgi:hypothetical protein
MNLKLLVLSCLSYLLINNFTYSQTNSSVIRCVAVKSDKNIILETGPSFAESKTDECYIVDGNESKGYIELEFEGINASKAPQSITLILNSADVEYAETSNGLSVFIDSQNAGTISQIYRNERVEIPLDVNILKSKNKFLITLKANGDDGLYLLSKKSGYGPFLLITY